MRGEKAGASMVKVRIPTPLRTLTEGQAASEGAEGQLAQVIEHLEANYPGLKDRLCDEGGELRRFVNIYVNGEDVRFLSGLETNVNAGDEVSIVPAVAGG